MWSRTTWTCHICKTNYNRQAERNKLDSILRTWWKGLSREEKVAWFKRNKVTYEPNKRHAFDVPGVYEESSSDKTQHKEVDLYDYLTPDDWVIRERQLGRCGGGTVEQQLAIGMERYKEMCMNKDVRKKRRQNMWLIGVFKGCLLYTSPSPRDRQKSRMPSSA